MFSWSVLTCVRVSKAGITTLTYILASLSWVTMAVLSAQSSMHAQACRHVYSIVISLYLPPSLFLLSLFKIGCPPLISLVNSSHLFPLSLPPFDYREQELCSTMLKKKLAIFIFILMPIIFITFIIPIKFNLYSGKCSSWDVGTVTMSTTQESFCGTIVWWFEALSTVVCSGFTATRFFTAVTEWTSSWFDRRVSTLEHL